MLWLSLMLLSIMPNSENAWTQLFKTVFGAGGKNVGEVITGSGREVMKNAPKKIMPKPNNSFDTIQRFKGKSCSFQGKHLLQRNETFDPCKWNKTPAIRIS
jgi:hypothetical protein